MSISSADIIGSVVEGATLSAEVFADVPVGDGGGSGGGGGGGGTGGGTGGGGGGIEHPAPVLIYSPPWRFLVTTRQTAATTFLDRRAMNRTITYELNMPAQAAGTASSDDPEVYIAMPDGDPYLAEGSRLLYCFRREGAYDADGNYTPWVCRFAGILLQIEDLTQVDQPLSTFTSFDPWQYLMSRPVVNADGTLPGRAGITSADPSFPSKKGSDIALELLRRTILWHGACGIDAGVAYGGTSHFGEGGGSLVATDEVDVTFEQGMMVGEAWQRLTDTNSIDINLAPIYDPRNRAGYMSELQIAPQLGGVRSSAIMAWDMPSRSLLNLDRLEDGTQRANIAQFFTQGGNPVPPAIDGVPPLDTPPHTPSQTKFGEYWATQLSIGQASIGSDIAAATSIIMALELAQVAIRRLRSTTINLDPAPARAPVPLKEYRLGDIVPIYASKRLRKPINGSGRIYKIPLVLDDDGVERVEQLDFSADSLDVE